MRMNAQAPTICATDTPQEKHRHYGFAQVPRLITRGTYKTLSLIEKGLYTCLKDICGDAGECFYTLRRLAQEICTSISTLSRYIPKLVQRGLIAATKKPGTHNKHEIYHIAIVDIWQENDATYKPKIVSDSNNLSETVSSGNKDGDSVSDSNNHQENGEQNETSVSSGNKDCFYLNDRVITIGEEDSVIPNESIGEDISSTSVDDALPPYEQGYLDQATLALLEFLEQETTRRFSDTPPSLPLTPAQEAQLYTSSPPVDNDTVYHSHSHTVAIGDEMDTTKPAPQAKSTKKKTTVKQEEMAGHGPPQKPPDDMVWSTRKCLAWFLYWRGKPLIGKWKNMQASECAKGLAENYTEAQVIQARNDMELDSYYVMRGGADICDVANNIHKYLKRHATGGKKYKPSPDEELVEWQGQMMTVAEADKRGFNGGFGEYVSQQQF